MHTLNRIARPALLALAACAASACTSTYTGPIEVTRFVSQQPASLGQGTITISFPDEMENINARNAFASAVADELSSIGYQVIMDGSAQATNVAVIRTSRNAVEVADAGSPVSVGVGAGTGSYGSGVGLGVGINLGGGNSGPRVITDLSVRISGPDGSSQWEGRAQQPTSIKSPYADVEASARTLAAALFKDFPGGNGETISIDVDELR